MDSAKFEGTLRTEYQSWDMEQIVQKPWSIILKLLWGEYLLHFVSQI